MPTCVSTGKGKASPGTPWAGDDWLEGALQASLLKLPAFTPQGLALMLWALAVLQARPPLPLLVPILQVAQERAPSFCPQVKSTDFRQGTHSSGGAGTGTQLLS
eukprot:scaffold62213_cov29-Tisochrysis_lutea.AAC.1